MGKRIWASMHGSFRARGASMTVVGGRIDVSDWVMAPTISAISASRVPGRDGSVHNRGSGRRPPEILLM